MKILEQNLSLNGDQSHKAEEWMSQYFRKKRLPDKLGSKIEFNKKREQTSFYSKSKPKIEILEVVKKLISITRIQDMKLMAIESKFLLNINVRKK